MYDGGGIRSLCICITSIWLEIKPNSTFTYTAEGLYVGISHRLTPLLSLAGDLCGIRHFYAPPGALQQNACLPAPGQSGQRLLCVVPSCWQRLSENKQQADEVSHYEGLRYQLSPVLGD